MLAAVMSVLISLAKLVEHVLPDDDARAVHVANDAPLTKETSALGVAAVHEFDGLIHTEELLDGRHGESPKEKVELCFRTCSRLTGSDPGGPASCAWRANGLPSQGNGCHADQYAFNGERPERSGAASALQQQQPMGLG